MKPNFFFFFLDLFDLLSCSVSTCSGAWTGHLGPHWQLRSSSGATGLCVDPMGQLVARLVPLLLLLLPEQGGESPILALWLFFFFAGGHVCGGPQTRFLSWFCVSVLVFLSLSNG